VFLITIYIEDATVQSKQLGGAKWKEIP